MPRVDAGDLQLTREGGFPPGLIKAVLERGLTAELTEHLGYEKGDPAGRGSPNSHNGTTPKTVATEVGDIGLDTPRDRAGTFEPRLVPKGPPLSCSRVLVCECGVVGGGPDWVLR